MLVNKETFSNFFSSRRRHTRCNRDWSSDVCSSDLRDTPIFTCIAMGLREALDTLGAPGDAAATSVQRQIDGAGWTRVADLAELPVGTSKMVYFQGEQVALFNVDGQVYAIDNRCSHANGPLAEGQVEGTTVTCPWHNSRFDLRSGQPLAAPAARPVPTYRVRVDEGAIYVAREEGVPAASEALE